MIRDKIYHGDRMSGLPMVTVRVLKHGRKATPLRHVAYHSPDGFAWSHQGSGPADLALSILVNHLGERPPLNGWKDNNFSAWTEKSQAWRFHYDFERTFVAQWHETWEVTSADIQRWLQRIQKETKGNHDGSMLVL